LWLHSLKVAQLLRSAACLHTNQSRSYLNHLVICNKNQQNARFFINDLIQLHCLRHVSNSQVFNLSKSCTCSFMVLILKHILASTILLIRTHVKHHKTSCKSLPEDEHLDVRNMSKTI